MTGREKAAAGSAAVLALGITGYSAWKLIGTGILSWHAAQPEFHGMMAELPAVWLVLFLIFFCDGKYAGKRVRKHDGSAGERFSLGAYNDFSWFSWRSWWGIAAAAAVFCWLHVIFLPVLLAAVYAGYLILTGAWFRKTVMGVRDKAAGTLDCRQKMHSESWLCWDFLLGSAVTIAEFCLLSLGNQGSIKKLRLWVVVCGVILAGRAAWELTIRRRDRHWLARRNDGQWSARRNDGQWSDRRNDGQWSDRRRDRYWSDRRHDGQMTVRQSDGQWSDRQSDRQWSDRQSDGQWSDRRHDGQRTVRQSDGQWSDRQSDGQWSDRQSDGQWLERRHNGQMTVRQCGRQCEEGVGCGGGDGTKSGYGRRNSKELACRAAMTAAIITMVFLQAGRMNLAVDFDSIWYGVRSHVMLDSGNGIYENLGTLGVVYTYSKGLETLTLPLAGLPSYSFIIAFNVAAAGMTLLAAFETAAVFMKRSYALWVPFLMAAVPGIMNMADTAKADLMTLFCQILMLQGAMRYYKGAGCKAAAEDTGVCAGTEHCGGVRKAGSGRAGELGAGWLALALTAGGVSLTMKPTALVFSTAIVGISMFWMMREWILDGFWRHRGQRKSRFQLVRGWNLDGLWRRTAEGQGRYWLAVLPAVIAGAGIWGRTLKLVGVPVTSVFYQVFQKMGFRVKYPFYASGFPSAGSGMAAAEKMHFLLNRLYGVFLNPQGDDMGHVIIAWGTVLPLVMAVVVFAFCGVKAERKRKSTVPKEHHRLLWYLAAVLAALLFIDFVSLYSLSQIDGNYYMLTYTVIILLGCGCMAQYTDFCRKSAYALMIPVWLYGVVLCGLTNWAWALGNGGIQPVNRGYYPHTEVEYEKRAVQGSQAIWDILASNPKNRVIALGEHPGVLTFPCWVQSYVDVSGYWGNPEVVADAPSFLQYLQFADVDYLYMEKEYVDTSVRIYQIVRSLVEQGWLYDVRDENGNLILSVKHPGPGDAGDNGNIVNGESIVNGENIINGENIGNGGNIGNSGNIRNEEEILKNLQVFDQRYIQHP